MLAQVKLRDGGRLPSIMLGTNGMEYSTLHDVCIAAYNEGCYAFDTAPNYKSGQFLGKVIKSLNNEFGIKREQLFIQTKLDWKDQMNGKVEEAVLKSLNILGLEYIDSYLMHWPYPKTFVQDWKLLEKFHHDGLVRYIGTCNYRERHWKMLLDSDIEIIPHINQIEIHPLRTCNTLLEFCKKNSIVTQAYTPICKMLPPIAENATLLSLSEKYKCSIPQLVLAWHIHRGIIPINKTTKPTRIKENFSCTEIHIDIDDIDKITSLNEDYKFMVESWGCPGF